MCAPRLEIAICGGGACGLAVVLNILQRSKSYNLIRSIHLYDRSEKTGQGLAYSSGCGETIINMRANTMGIYASHPLHFSQWIASNHPELQGSNYPPRSIYGEYLSALFGQALLKADELGICLTVTRQEIVNVVSDNGRFVVIEENGSERTVDKVVLALGNFAARRLPPEVTSIHDGYFETPWPVQKLNRIPTTSTVCIVGSRLSGIDAAFHLADNGHKGLIYLVSRGGRLPTVQNRLASAQYEHKYALELLARDLEYSRAAETAFHRLVEQFSSFIRDSASDIHSKILSQLDVNDQFFTDIRNAEMGTQGWRAVADSAAPILERYWNCLSVLEQSTFMSQWNSTWCSIVHAMPYENAVRLQSLMQKGQVIVSDLREVQRNGSHFLLLLPKENVQVDFLIEASGFETDSSKVDSRLLRSLIDGRFLEAHPAGGISVDVDTLESTTTEGIYVIGSLTTGVHFYTNGIDRNAVHASRIASHMAGEPMEVPGHTAIFLPSCDRFIRAWTKFLVSAIPAMLKSNLVPFIYIVEDQPQNIKNNTLMDLPTHTTSVDCTTGVNTSASRTSLAELCAEHGIALTQCGSATSLISTLSQHYIETGLLLEKLGPQHTILLSYFELADSKGTGLTFLEARAVRFERNHEASKQVQKLEQAITRLLDIEIL